MTLNEAQERGAERMPVLEGRVKRYLTRRKQAPGIKVGYRIPVNGSATAWVWQWHMAIPPYGAVGKAWAEWCRACLPLCCPHPQSDCNAWEAIGRVGIVRPAAVWVVRDPNGGALNVAHVEPGRIV